MKKICIAISILISQLYVCIANEYLPVERYTVEQGLPDNSVKKVYFDSYGFLWLGTDDGLCRFDGVEYIAFHTSLNENTTIASEKIIDLVEDVYDRIWVLTAYGLELIDLKTLEFKQVIPNEEQEFHQLKYNSYLSELYLLSINQIVRIKISNDSWEVTPIANIKDYIEESISTIKPEGNQLLIAGFRSVYRYYQNLDSISLVSQLPPDRQDNNYIIDIHAIGDDIFLGTSHGLYQFNSSDNRMKKMNLQYNMTDVKQIIPVDSNRFFCISKEGIFEVNISQQSNELISGFKPEVFSGVQLNDIQRGYGGLFWVASSHGLYKINPFQNAFSLKWQSGLWERIQPNFELLNSDKTNLFIQGRRGNLLNFTIQTDEINLVNDLGFISQKRLTSTKQLSDQEWIIGTEEGLVYYNSDQRTEFWPDSMLNLRIYDLDTSNQNIWIATDQGLFICSVDSFRNKKVLNPSRYLESTVMKRIAVQENTCFLVTDTDIKKYTLQTGDLRILLKYKSEYSHLEIYDHLLDQGGTFWIATNDGLYNTTSSGEALTPYDFRWKNSHISALVEQNGSIFLSSNKGISIIDKKTGKIQYFGQTDGLPTKAFIDKGIAVDKHNQLFFLSRDGLLTLTDSLLHRSSQADLKIVSADLMGNRKSYSLPLLNSDTLYVEPEIQYLSVRAFLLDYYSTSNNRYEYCFTTQDNPDHWIDNGYSGDIVISRPISGTYNLFVQATNTHGIECKELQQLTIVYRARFWLSKWAYAIYIILFIVLMYLSVFIRTRQLRKINREYKEREIIARKVEVQKEELTLKNKNITDSINYAKRIQMAMMPSRRVFKNLFPDSFILHLPKDIVSGDFYWVNKVGNRTFFSAVDCTGHGVPGAFMSIIGFELFRRITETEKLSQPAEILNQLSKNFARLFSDEDDLKLRDGMDLAFCAIDEEQKILEFSGAFNPLYIVRDNSIIEIKGDRFSVGLNEGGENGRSSFGNHVVPLQDGDIIYIFTDGYADQFGGPEGKKYKYRRFRHLLLALHQLPLHRQEEFLKKSIMEWKGDLDQVDDILVMGVRINHQ